MVSLPSLRSAALFSPTSPTKMLRVLPKSFIHTSFHLRAISRVPRLSPFCSCAVASSAPPQPPSQTTSSATSLLRSYSFSDDQIDLICHKQPRLITWSPERIQPKLDCFLSFGFSPAELSTLITLDPLLLSQSAENRLLFNLNFLHKMLGSKQLIKKTIGRSSRVLKHDLDKVLMPNVSVLQSHGVPRDKITQAVVNYPTVMMNKTEAFSDVVNELKSLGMDPAFRAFIVAINAKLVINKEKWDRKLALYRSLGWSDDDFLTAFRKHPYCMLTSEWKIKKMMKFYVEKLGWSPVFLSQNPILNDLSLEKRIAPRCAVLEVLASRALLEKGSLHALFLMAGILFKEKFVSRHIDSIPLVVEAYETREPGDYPALKLWQQRTMQKSILAAHLQS